MEQTSSHWTSFHEILYFNIFRKSVEKIQLLLQYDKKYQVLYMNTYVRRSFGK